jgi:hypothetical protein
MYKIQATQAFTSMHTLIDANTVDIRVAIVFRQALYLWDPSAFSLKSSSNALSWSVMKPCTQSPSWVRNRTHAITEVIKYIPNIKSNRLSFPSLLETSLNYFFFFLSNQKVRSSAPPAILMLRRILSPWRRQLGSSYWTGLYLLARWMALMWISLEKHCPHCQDCFIHVGWSMQRPNSDSSEAVYWVITASHELGGIVTGPTCITKHYAMLQAIRTII